MNVRFWALKCWGVCRCLFFRFFWFWWGGRCRDKVSNQEDWLRCAWFDFKCAKKKGRHLWSWRCSPCHNCTTNPKETLREITGCRVISSSFGLVVVDKPAGLVTEEAFLDVQVVGLWDLVGTGICWGRWDLVGNWNGHVLLNFHIMYLYVTYIYIYSYIDPIKINQHVA